MYNIKQHNEERQATISPHGMFVGHSKRLPIYSHSPHGGAANVTWYFQNARILPRHCAEYGLLVTNIAYKEAKLINDME